MARQSASGEQGPLWCELFEPCPVSAVSAVNLQLPPVVRSPFCPINRLAESEAQELASDSPKNGALAICMVSSFTAIPWLPRELCVSWLCGLSAVALMQTQ